MRLNAFLALGDRLCRARAPIDPTQIQRTFNLPQAGITQSTFYNWLDHLRFQRVLRSTPEGLAVDRRRLLSFYAAHRLVRARPLYRTTAGLAGPELVAHLEGRGHHNVALGFLSAANEWAFFEPRRATELYAARNTARSIRSALPPGDNPVTVFAENWSELPVLRRNETQCTDLFTTIVDCLAHPEGGAHADFLQRELLWGRGK